MERERQASHRTRHYFYPYPLISPLSPVRLSPGILAFHLPMRQHLNPSQDRHSSSETCESVVSAGRCTDRIVLGTKEFRHPVPAVSRRHRDMVARPVTPGRRGAPHPNASPVGSQASRAWRAVA
jgi:hypothetical protein